MDKQKQIEELEKDIAVRMAMAKGIAGSMNKGVEGWLGEYLIEKGWVQIPENAVVLTREEYNNMQFVTEFIGTKQKIGACDFNRVFLQHERKIRKETAEKFAERLKTECFDGGIDDKRVSVSFSRLDEICKEITEGK